MDDAMTMVMMMVEEGENYRLEIAMVLMQ